MKAEQSIGLARDTIRRAVPDTSPEQTDPRLTMRQSQIIAAIRDSMERNGYAPSLREIGRAVGLKSTSSVAHQLSKLEELGLLTRDPQRPRTYKLVTGSEPTAPAAAPQSSTCSFLGNGAEESGTVFVLQVMVGAAVGAALLDGALVTVKSDPPGPDAPPRTDHATLLGQVVALTHPLMTSPSVVQPPDTAPGRQALPDLLLPTPGESVSPEVSAGHVERGALHA